MFDTMKKLFVVNANVKENKSSEDQYLDRLCDLTEDNKQTIGGKSFANIARELLKVSVAYQRLGTLRKEKVTDLINNFDFNCMDTLIVSFHAEEKRYYIINGVHRWLAATAKGITSLPCEIKVFPGDPAEREKAEARYFIEQEKYVDRLSPTDMHKGHVLCGDYEYVVLDNAVNETNGQIFIKFDKNKGKQLPGALTGYNQAVSIARRSETLIKDVFDIMIAAQWNSATQGLSKQSLKMVSEVLFTHNDPEVKREIARVLRDIKPRLFFAKAQAAYELRTAGEASSLYLEDYVCTNLGIERLIDAKDSKRFNPTEKKPVA